MATKTKQELVIRALRIIGVVGTGQEPSAENVSDVGALVEPMFARLEAVEDIYAPPVDEIPESYFEPYAILLAKEAVEFGPLPPEANPAGAMDDLRMLATREPVVSPYLKADIAIPRGYYYRRGRYSW